jgi:hypothetical protein
MRRRVARVRTDTTEERIVTEALSVSSQCTSVATYCYVVPNSLILSTPIMKAIRSSETWF